MKCPECEGEMKKLPDVNVEEVANDPSKRMRVTGYTWWCPHCGHEERVSGDRM